MKPRSSPSPARRRKPSSLDSDPNPEFQQLQGEFYYRKAQVVLEQMVNTLDLSQRERSQLEPAVRGLNRMLTKLNQEVVQIAVFGLVGRGKSSLLNALLGEPVFTTGATHGVTQRVEMCPWSLAALDRSELARSELTSSELARSDWSLSTWDPSIDPQTTLLSLPSLGQSRVELVDTPGLDEIDGENRERLALKVAKRVDLILFVVSGDITQVEYDALLALRQASKPILLVFNKVDQYPEADRLAIYEKIRDDRLQDLISPAEIVMAAAAPLETQADRRPDGQITIQRQPGQPQITDLKLKILDLLHREGKALVALNSMLYADAANHHIVSRKMEIRDHAADQLIWNAAVTKGLAVALNPLTILDMVSGAAIDVVMILSLARLYGLPLTEHGAVNLLQKIALSMGSLTVTDLFTNLGLSSLKGLLSAAAPATAGASLAPYVPVASTQAAVAGLSSYGIGRITKTYLAQGATWGADGPKALVQTILSSLDDRSILSRLRQELELKIRRR
ncbi:MAG: GTP-binding protein [Prochlorothrix sp.]|nr:GTP-binding protein [Prochlorothrix sp.]